MARSKKHVDSDGKSAAAGTDLDLTEGGPATNGHDHDSGGAVFDAPMGAEEAITQLVELNHERNECAQRWEDAKSEASEAKKELDNASNAISLLIDRIDRQRTGETAQPVLRTLTTGTDDAHA